MAAIRSFRDLDVYKLGLDEARKIFLLTKSFAVEERYSLSDQIAGRLREPSCHGC